jgi:hypothetical protein
MKKQRPDLLSDERMLAAIGEIKQLILSGFPEATFSVGYGDDPFGVYIDAVVDVEDRFEVMDLYTDRLVDMQIEDELPLHVLVLRTPERNAAIMREQLAERRNAGPVAVQ